MDDSAKGKYDLILGRDLVTALVLNIKFSDHAIESDDGNIKLSMAPMVNLCTYKFKGLETWENTPKNRL